MGKIRKNERLPQGFCLLQVEEPHPASMGQFYMLRSWENYPVLSRPVSVFDSDGTTVTFLYKVIGQGTRLLSSLREGDEIVLNGPYGNGFPNGRGKIALVGGGAGVAPLYLAAKTLMENPGTETHLFLGYSGKELLHEEFARVSDALTVNVGGLITDCVDTRRYDMILSCGPEAMMRALWEKCRREKSAARVYVSLEHRMACGVGACLGCTVPTASGRRRVCKDGPVFAAEEVFFHE